MIAVRRSDMGMTILISRVKCGGIFTGVFAVVKYYFFRVGNCPAVERKG